MGKNIGRVASASSFSRVSFGVQRRTTHCCRTTFYGVCHSGRRLNASDRLNLKKLRYVGFIVEDTFDFSIQLFTMHQGVFNFSHVPVK